ncbi:MAG: Rieske 2Fe-2S domain-containing protein [Acidimicrobiia bacterium]
MTTTHVDRLVLSDRVHSDVYTDPAIFDEELDRIFHRGWVYVGHESEIAGIGDYRTRTIGRQPVILVRGEDGAVRVLMNRCTHKGTLVCPYEKGTARIFTCAYHSWSFRNDGSLLSVPHDERYGDSFDKGQLGLREAPRVGIYRGFVFASLSPDGQAFDHYLTPGARAAIDLFTDIAPLRRVSASAGVHKYSYMGNWKLQCENNVDAYHFNFVHRSFWQIMNKRAGVRMDFLGTATSAARIRSLGNGHVGWDYRPLQAKTGALAVSDDPRLPDATRAYYAMLIERDGRDAVREMMTASPAHAYIFPNVCILASQIRVMQPTAVDRTELYVYPMMLDGAPDEINLKRIRAHEGFYGPAGGGATDDFEIFARGTIGMRATVDPWMNISRGAGMEEIDADGHVSGQITDELGSRTILHHWREVMSGRGPDDVGRRATCSDSAVGR